MTGIMGKVGIRLIPLKGVIEDMRLIKDEEEIACIRRSVQLNEQVFADIYPTITPGQTEIDVALAIESAMRQRRC